MKRRFDAVKFQRKVREGLSEKYSSESHMYKTNSELLKGINDAVMVLKRVQYELPGKESLSPEQVAESQRLLSKFLGAVIQGLSPSLDKGREDFTIPGSLIQRISEAKKGELRYYIEDLRRANAHLNQNLALLTQEDLNLLNELVGF